MRIPADWHPEHPGYALHLARTQLRLAAGIAETLLEMVGAPDPKSLLAAALWDLAMERDAERATAKVIPLSPPGGR